MAIDPGKFKVAKEVQIKEILLCMAPGKDPERTYAAGSGATIQEVNGADEKPEPMKLEQAHSSYITGMARAGKHLVSGGYDRQLIWWDSESGAQVRSVKAHERWIRGVVASPDGNVIASVADDMVCRLWNAESGKKLRELKGHAAMTPNNFHSMLHACAFSSDGQFIATGDKVGQVIIWEVNSGKQVKTLSVPGVYTWDPKARIHSIGGIRSLAFSPDGKQLAIGGMGKVGNIDHLEGKSRVEVFRWEGDEKIGEFESDKFKGLVEHLAWHPDGSWLCAGGGDNGGFLRFLDVNKKQDLFEVKAPMHVHEFAFNDTFDRIFTVGHEKVAWWKLG